MSHAPHKVHSVFIDDEFQFVPVGVDKIQLRAETFRVTEHDKLILTLSDYYADEYNINMGPATPAMTGFVEMLVHNHRFCKIKAHKVTNPGGKTFFKPVVETMPVSVDRFTFV